MSKTYDCAGWATVYNRPCSDGRTIKPGSFDHMLPCTLPVMWQHQHNQPNNCLGHADLEPRPNGVYAYVSFNDTENGQQAKELVRHGDICSFSIFANQLKENRTGNRSKDVIHGTLRELSLVVSGANPGAFIEVSEELQHSGDDDGYSATIYPGEEYLMIPSEEYYLEHAGTEEEPEEKKEEPKMAEETKAAGGKTVAEVLETFNDEQKKVLLYLLEQAKNGGSEETEGGEMKHNAWENDGSYMANGYDDGPMLTHADEEAILNAWRSSRGGSLKEIILEYAQENGQLAHAANEKDYGIEDLEILFPDAQYVANMPDFIDRRTEWVKVFMDATTKLPFSRVKMMHADITADEARALGYGKKGEKKISEVIKLMRREFGPTTVYKMQKLDKDDMRDITRFDVFAWLEAEMTGKLHEEIARAALLGDGRDDLDKYKIKEDCIKPILTDDELYCIKYVVEVPSTATAAEITSACIDGCVRARKQYKGSGSTTLFTTEDYVSEGILLKDLNGHRLYDDESKMATAARVAKIETVELMEGLKTEYNSEQLDVFGIIVNPKDYSFGSDHGSAIETFKQFDLDYNQEKVLKETRCSGGLTKVKSAIVVLVKKVSA